VCPNRLRKRPSRALREFQLRPRETFLYTCGAIDLWEWECRLLDQEPGRDGDEAPICLGGRGAAPVSGGGRGSHFGGAMVARPLPLDSGGWIRPETPHRRQLVTKEIISDLPRTYEPRRRRLEKEKRFFLTRGCTSKRICQNSFLGA
jgi:hypothetical protein